MVLVVKNPPANVGDPGLEDPLEKGMATQSNRIRMPIESPWTEEPGGLQSTESQRVRHDWATNLHNFTFTV